MQTIIFGAKLPIMSTSNDELEKTVAARVPQVLFEKIQKFHRKLAKGSATRVNRSDAIRVLLERGAAAEKL